MKAEDKELLVRAICGYLPYGLEVNYDNEICDCVGYAHGKVILVKKFSSVSFGVDTELVKPYLRPMGLMTEKEKFEYCDLQDRFLCSSQYLVTDAFEMFDWLNKNGFDYCGLIDKGLALSMTEGMYNFKE